MLLSMELGLFSLALLLLVTSIRYIYTRFMSRCGVPESIPWAGAVDGGNLSRARATLQSLLSTRQLLNEGYTEVRVSLLHHFSAYNSQYSKNGLPFVLPNITTGPEVILPMSQMDWLLKQPDNVLDQNEVNRQFLQADHTMLHPRIILDRVHEDVIVKELTKSLGEFADDVQAEVDFAFRKNWGINTKDWIEVGAYSTSLDIISRISTRVIAGLPLCKLADRPISTVHCLCLKVATRNFLQLSANLHVW